ncbi:Carbohydrate-binding X8 domain superfamily protein [Euphorbia peplus]|nr:Carbohydrate-binding X8 domain superfamily protein [Euphorbia peplus]
MASTSIALFLLLSTTTFVNGQNPNKLIWCVPKPGVSNQILQENLDFACGKIDCKAIKPGGFCAEPNTVKDRAAWAMNTYYLSSGNKDSDCDFKGSGQLVFADPSHPKCKFYNSNDVPFAAPKWCIAKTTATDQQMQAQLDYACGSGKIDCKPIQQGGSCFEPNTVRGHASYAMNALYKTTGKEQGQCDFSGVGTVVTNKQSYGNCKYL